MTQDGGRHKTIREELIKKIRGTWGEVGVYYSHGEKGDIDFYRIFDGKSVHIAQPDIVLITKDERSIIVEIELSNSPKHLLGVAFASMFSEKGKFKKENLKIENKSLLIVLDSEKIPEDGSGKPEQIKELIFQIEKISEKFRGFDRFDIVKEDKAFNKINDWINTKKEEFSRASPPN